MRKEYTYSVCYEFRIGIRRGALKRRLQTNFNFSKKIKSEPNKKM